MPQTHEITPPLRENAWTFGCLRVQKRGCQATKRKTGCQGPGECHQWWKFQQLATVLGQGISLSESERVKKGKNFFSNPSVLGEYVWGQHLWRTMNFSTLADSVVFGREWKSLVVSWKFDLRWHHYMRCMPSQPTRAGVWQIWSRLALEITPKWEFFGFYLPFKAGGKNWTKNGLYFCYSYHTSLHPRPSTVARAYLGM